MIDFVLITIGALFAIVPVLVIFAICMEGISFFFGIEEKNWGDSVGVIEESSLQYSDDGDRLDAVIRFKFLIGDQPYWGTQNRFDGVRTDQDARDFISKYPVGTGVIVYYNRNDPEYESTIDDPSDSSEPTKVPEAILILGLQLVLLLAGGTLIYFGFNPPDWSPLPIFAFGD